MSRAAVVNALLGCLAPADRAWILRNLPQQVRAELSGSVNGHSDAGQVRQMLVRQEPTIQTEAPATKSKTLDAKSAAMDRALRRATESAPPAMASRLRELLSHTSRVPDENLPFAPRALLVMRREWQTLGSTSGEDHERE